MATQIAATTYDPVVSANKFVGVGVPDGRRRAQDRPKATAPDMATPRPPAGMAAIEQVLQLLARALRQFHTYPATSPLCADAVAACGNAIALLERRDQIVVRVMLHDLLVDETAVGAGTIIEHELVRRLHRAGVAVLTIDRAASLRDLSRFCSDLISLHDSGDRKTNLAELLIEHGVDTIVARTAYRPEVVDIGTPRAPACDLVRRERERRQRPAAAGPVAYLYPPDKGWVRTDPTSSFTSISLADLAILVNDPAEFAAVLVRLTDDAAAAAGTRQSALELKFSDVSTVFASLDPRLAQIMFARLARAVLDLEPGPRQALLQRTILPGLLDGRADGRVLTEFPDIDLADSLCLLLNLETAAPEVLSAALDRMNLTADRRQALEPLLDDGIRQRGARRLRDTRQEGADAGEYARTLLQIDSALPASFREFAAFDLAVDAQAHAAIAEVRTGIEATDPLVIKIRCLSQLMRLEPNPNAVEGFLAGMSALLTDLERASRWQELAEWLVYQRELAEALHGRRPDVADAISAALTAFCTRTRIMTLAALYDGVGRDLANMMATAYGAAMTPGCLALLDDPSVQAAVRSLPQLMSEHAALLAPALSTQLGNAGSAAAIIGVRVLGVAGPGYESAIAAQLQRGDEQVVREALRALARIGSAQAAALVAAQLGHASAWVRNAAQEALSRFAPARVQIHLRDLLGRRDFVRRHPDTAVRLLDRAAQIDRGSLRQTLDALAPLRFHFWRPALARLGARARALTER